jgi:electron transfer flavoprotein alpha subunit
MASNIWVFAQGDQGVPTSATLELLTKARALGESVTVFLAGTWPARPWPRR